MRWWCCRHDDLFLAFLFANFQLRSLINTRNYLSVSSARINFAPPVSRSMGDIHGSRQQSSARRGLAMSYVSLYSFRCLVPFIYSRSIFVFTLMNRVLNSSLPSIQLDSALQLLAYCVHCIETWDCHASTLM
jgi:hypothetical protein